MKTLQQKSNGILRPARLRAWAILLITLGVFGGAHAQAGSPCDFSKLRENSDHYFWLPDPLPDGPYSVSLTTDGKVSPGGGTGHTVHVGSSAPASGGVMLNVVPCPRPRFPHYFTSGVVHPSRILAGLIFNYVFQKEVHKSATCCAPGDNEQSRNAITDFAKDQLMRFLDCLFPILNQWENGSEEDKKNAAKLREVLKGVLGAKVKQIEDALASNPLYLGGLSSAPKSAEAHRADAEYLKKVIAEVTTKRVGGGLSVP